MSSVTDFCALNDIVHIRTLRHIKGDGNPNDKYVLPERAL